MRKGSGDDSKTLLLSSLKKGSSISLCSNYTFQDNWVKTFLVVNNNKNVGVICIL